MICLELPDTLDALEVEEATELEEDILDNVESVETGDIVDVLPNPPAPTPPGSNRKSVVTNIIMMVNINLVYSQLSLSLFKNLYLSKNLNQNHCYYDCVHDVGPLRMEQRRLWMKRLRTFLIVGLVLL